MNKQPILDPFSNVVSTGVAVCDMNKFLGNVLERITLVLGGGAFTRAMVTLIQLKANGKVIWESDGTKADLTSQYFRTAADSTIIKIDFMDRLARSLNAFHAGAIDLSDKSGIKSLRLEVTTSGATTPTLVGFADVSPPSDASAEAGVRWYMTRRHRVTYVAGAAGTFALPVPHLDPSGGGGNFRRIWIYSSNITAIKTVRDGVTEHELTKAQNEASQKDNGRVPQAGLIVFDPCQDGFLDDRIWDTRPSTSGVRSAQFYATFSAGETITIEAEELLPLAAY